MEFNVDIDEPLPGTYADFPGEDNGVHHAVRALHASMDQIDAFFTDGVVIQTCDGVCDPE